ncbi:unnamed protein product [Urochloa decumbens]|uniref:RING-type domain-containing protein n=1 Tax=Urochloa decumbens TaxID=240449 RepID=A0ABC8YY69_9POAL
MGAGDGNDPATRPHNMMITGDGHGNCSDKIIPMPQPPPPRRHGPAAPRQVNDAGNYAVAGKLLLATAGAFAGVLLALVALHLYSTSRRRRRSLADAGSGGGGHQRRQLLRSLAIYGAGDGDDRDGGAAPSPRGLDPAVLAAIPVVVLGAGAAVGDCAVCLAELEPGEKARALPRCGHRFHAECIDAWFRGNATCPLCRADVVAVASAVAPSAPAEDGAPPPDEVRIDVAGDAAAAPNAPVAPAMARLPSATTDRGKAREVFASARFAASF